MPVKQTHIIVEPKVTAFMLRRETIKVEAEVQQVVVATLDIRHDEIDIPSTISVQEEMHHDEIGVTNAKREKKGRTKKERKSTQGRKTKSGVVREPMQLSLDVRTIQTLAAMKVNRSELFEELLNQHQPFLEKYAAVTGTASMEGRADKQLCSDTQARDAELADLRAKMADQAQRIEEQTRDISRLYNLLNVEKRYIQERGTKQRGFKTFLKAQPKTPFIEKFLADQFAMPRDTRAHYEYRLGLLHCTEEELQEFVDLWKLMLLQQP